MANNRSVFFQALGRSENRRDGGYKHSWSFSLSGDEDRRPDPNVVTVEEMDRQPPASPDEKRSPALRQFTSSDPLRTYENRNNHVRPLNRMVPKRLSEVPLPVATATPLPNRTTNYFIISPASQGIVLQGRHFQHAQIPSPIRKPVQRNDFTTTQQAVEVDSIVLTCPEVPEENLNVKRWVQQKRRPLEDGRSFPLQDRAAEPLRPTVYRSVCAKCNQPSEDSSRCQSCGGATATPLPCQQGALSSPVPSPSPTPRPPIRAQLSPAASGLLNHHSFFKPAPCPSHSVSPSPSLSPSSSSAAAATRAPRGGEAVPVRVARVALLPVGDGRPPLLAGTSGCCGAPSLQKGKKAAAAQQKQLNDLIVLSSDEEDEADNASTGSTNRLDSVSPRPADSAHSSPAPSGGRVEAAVKSAAEQDEFGSDFFEDVNMKVTIPRRARMKDQFGNQPADTFSPRTKKPKVSSVKCDSIILECRSIRVGTLRRMVTKPVVFAVDGIQLETEGAERNSLEKVCLRASELISCEWCSLRKLPVLFFQTSEEECVRLRTQLHMSREEGGQWYDCSGDQSDEKFIVLIFENGLVEKEKSILADILSEIGRGNNLSDFPTQLSFDEANLRLVNYNKASKQKEEKVKPPQTPAGSSHGCRVGAAAAASMATRSRMATRQQAGSPLYEDEQDQDMTDLQPTFSGPVVKLMVYPPPPAKGGISVTNEDLHCLNDGEFLNDVIIDFYLKYLVLEKLRKEDAQKIHVFSSFFYKRLNQRERRNLPDATNLPIQKRKHNRVKTWTRHVDLFQKDFIFVPINESAHWYLAVICFPGLKGPIIEKNPLCPAPFPEAPPPEEQLPDHCRPLSPPEGDGLDVSSGGDPPPAVCEAAVAAEGGANGQTSFTEGSLEMCGAPSGSGGVQAEAEPQFTSVSHPCAPPAGELHRISVCYRSARPDDGGSAFSDDQSSCQDDCSEDGTLADDGPAADAAAALATKHTICRQPCILIMDSLRGPARSAVVKTLREYLEVEWEVRKGSQCSFGKEVMKGSSPRVPQQDNFSDCGVYVLQYVESFFENPVPSFHLPLNLSDWFPQQRMKTKREEIKELILEIQRQQQQQQQQQQQEVERREEPERLQAPPTAGPGSASSPSEELDIQETCCGSSAWSPTAP
ncbi:sentrin-specific protease 6 isoform X2 [Nelusetta ayraudi]|uniref:sentrin-specific protease 6 isoform X2 n=1 Tax=Nelusetta ayraudi TaxID=303726 RepID=UPI003F6E8D80